MKTSEQTLKFAEICTLECTRKSIINVNIASLCWRSVSIANAALSVLDTFVSIRRYHLVTEGESAHNEESRQEPYRTNNRFESRSKDGILLMGSRALMVDRASFPRSSILLSPSRSILLFLWRFGLNSHSDSRYTRKTRQTSNSCTGDKSNAITRPLRELLRECL